MLRYRHRASQAVRERLLIPLRQLTALEIAVAIAIGVVGGVFPVPLVTSFITLLTGWCVRCSAAELVVGSTVNLFCTPLQIALLPSFARLAGSLTREDTTAFTAAALKEAIGKGIGVFLRSCGWMIAYATLAWCIIFIPLIFALRALQRYASHHAQHKESLRLARMEDVYVSED